MYTSMSNSLDYSQANKIYTSLSCSLRLILSFIMHMHSTVRTYVRCINGREVTVQVSLILYHDCYNQVSSLHAIN